MVEPPTPRGGLGSDGGAEDEIDSATIDSNDAVEAAMQYLDDPASLPDHLSYKARALIESIAAARADQDAFDTVRATRTPSVAPAMADDPLAVALGLVPPTDMNLAGALLRAARQKAGMKPSALARRLIDEGHDVSAGKIARWESADVVPLAESEINSIASIFGIPPTDLIDGASSVVTPGLAMSKQFRGLVRRWATHTNQTLAAAQNALMKVAVAPARRGTSRDDAAVIASLQAYVDARLSEES